MNHTMSHLKTNQTQGDFWEDEYNMGDDKNLDPKTKNKLQREG